jgi:Flp pilus assembly protein TadD
MQKWRVHRGLGFLRKALSIRPDNWAALWVMGKALQVLGKSHESLEAFSTSHSINPQHADVAREASISAMECSRYDVARSFAEKAKQLRPGDSGLSANLALVLLLSQDPRAAKEQVELAHAADPQDRITRTLRQIVDEVIAGTRPCPRHTREL